MRRVDKGSSLSELTMVKGQYEAFIEEHLGVSNRNLRRVDLDGNLPLKKESIKRNLRTCEWSL